VRDQERLLREVAAADEPSEEDLAAARALLAERSPEELAAALVRLHRARLPAPEELVEAAPRHRDGPGSRPERGYDPDRSGSRSDGVSRSRPGEGNGAWFRMNIGRTGNADPRWLVPIICRRGGVTKRDIGEIRILDRETQFEILTDSAARYTEGLRRPDTKDPEIRIEALPAGDLELDYTRPPPKPRKKLQLRASARPAGQGHRGQGHRGQGAR
jgi:ATP-dependent RNA helicase DeaD